MRARASARSAASWLRTRCQGPCRAGSVLFHAPSFAFQAPGGGENQLVQTGRHLEALGASVRLFSSLDRPARRGAPPPPVRHVARGTGAGPQGKGPGNSGGPLANLLVRAGRALDARARLDAEAGRPGRLVDSPDGPFPSRMATGAAYACATGSCPTRGPRPASSSPSSELTRGRIEVVPNGVLGAFQSASPAQLSFALRRRGFRPLRRPHRAPQEPAGPDPRGPVAGLALVVIGEAPRGGSRLLRAVPRRGRRSGQVAGGHGPRRPASGLGLRGGSGLCLAELVRDAGPGCARGCACRYARRDHAFWLNPRVFRRPGSVRPARSDRGDRPRDRPVVVARSRSSSGGICRFELSLARRRETNGGGV